MITIGLTGSIGMGKTTAGEYFREAGVPVHDSDAAVHMLYRGRAAPLIEAAFPSCTENGVVNRSALGAWVLVDQPALKKLEAIIHPLVAEARRDFIRSAQRAGFRCVVLDIPLLIETGVHRSVDIVAVVSAPAHVQRARVLQRPGMTSERFSAISAQQLPNAEKQRLAHVLIDSGGNRSFLRRQVRDLIRAAMGQAAKGIFTNA